MNTNIAEAPHETDVILYLKDGRIPVIAGYFQDEWQSAYSMKTISSEIIIGWNYIPE